jgi:type II secretory pathway pseudopilin PulG
VILKSHKGQRGAALLAFALLFVVAAGYVLVSELNASAARAARDERTSLALALAKEALIGYAATYPDNPATTDPLAGPGPIPCPDTDNDGDAEGNCSDASGTTIGRLPWRTLDLSDPVDAAGERLWYAISQTYRYGPNKTIPLNSEVPGTLSVDGTGDVVAVVFAPGPPIADQDTRDSAPEDVANYLEDDNADLDQSFVTGAAGEFNDRLIAVTRRELMRAAERRALAEAASALTRYYGTPTAPGYDAYPWAAPFVDPRESGLLASGTATAAAATTLTDTTAGVDFVAAGVDSGDQVRNLTDGSRGTVTGVAANSVTVAALTGGADNDFDAGDEYAVDFRITGTATAGSAGVVLEDTSKNFIARGVAAGDLVVNLTDGSIGAVADGGVAATVLTLIALNGGSTNAMSAGDGYELRRIGYHGTLGLREGHLPYHVEDAEFVTGFNATWNLSAATSAAPATLAAHSNAMVSFARSSADSGPISIPLAQGRCRWQAATSVECLGEVTGAWFTGEAGAGSSGLTLTDLTRNFGNWGVSRGDKLNNTTDGSRGIVSSVAGSTLTASGLGMGTANQFAPGDDYRVRVATGAVTSTIDFNFFGVLLDATPTYALSDVTPGDVVINNTTGQLGFLQSIIDFFGLGYRIRVATPAGGLWFGFLSLNDSYTIRRGFVESREYEFALRYSGATAAAVDNAGARERSVASAGTLPAKPATPAVTLIDYDAAGGELARATVTLAADTPIAANATVTTSGIRWDLDDTDLPAWFEANEWHRFVLAGFNAGDAAGAGGTGCTAGTDCLSLAGTAAPNDNKRALVVIAGGEIATMQDRASPATIAQYFEGENNSLNLSPGAEQYVVDPNLTVVNDQLRVLEIAP